MRTRDEVMDEIKDLIYTNKILIFIKGNRNKPLCNFSANALRILGQFEIKFHTVNVLKKPELAKYIKIYSNWPTIPQIYIDGEFIGGLDILEELNKTSELKEILERTLNS